MDRFDRQLELSDGIETEYLRILYYTFEKNYNDTYKSYEYKRLCTIVDGEKNVRINNGKNIIYDSSKYMLLPPNSSVEMKIEKPTKALVLELNEDLINTVSEIAYDLNMSLPSFSSKFKKIMGMTPNDYLTNLKLNEAVRLLKFSSVTEVAYDLGYENISHFIKLFKKKFGLTPKQYSLKYSGEVIQIQ
ncbi:helix-turn-helix transcriptional regulator [Clostridium perfringens]